MSDPWSEARQLRQLLVEARELGRRTAVHAWCVGCGVGIVVGYLLAQVR